MLLILIDFPQQQFLHESAPMSVFIRTVPASSTLDSIKTDVKFVSRAVLTIKCPVGVCNDMYCVANVSNKHAVFSNKHTRSLRNEQIKISGAIKPRLSDNDKWSPTRSAHKSLWNEISFYEKCSGKQWRYIGLWMHTLFTKYGYTPIFINVTVNKLHTE
jgi:hypothetical protein